MISYLYGQIILKKDKFIILEVNNIGYKVFLSRKTLSNLPEIGQNLNTSTPLNIKLFCFHNVKEDASDIYGFLTYDELDFFEILNDIRGVGPRAALEISSLGSLDKIKDRILKEDPKVFEGIPGIGSKKAMTIILELTGKIKTLNSLTSKDLVDESENALVQLGFSRQQAKEALSNVAPEVKDVEERVKLALKNLRKT